MKESTTLAPPHQPAVRKRRRRTKAVRKRTRRSRASRPSSGHHGEEESVTQEEIPAFSTQLRVCAENGRIDGIKLGVEFPLLVFDEAEEVNQFWNYLGGPNTESKGTESAAIHSPLFGVAGYEGQRALPLKFRKRSAHFDNPSTKINAPMLSGSLSGPRGSREGVHFCALRSAEPLSVNPTRAVNHRKEELLSGRPWREAIFRGDNGTFLRGLDGKSNLCPFDLTQADFRAAVRQHLENTVSALNDEVRRAWHLGNLFPLHNEDGTESTSGQDVAVKSLSAQQVETYWEFRDADAVARIGRLEEILTAFWKETKTTDHGFQAAYQRNAKTITIYKNSGTSIRIYAKETDRLRIEVIHSPQGSPNLIPRYSATSVDGLLEVTDTLAERAAMEVNELLEFIDEWSDESPKERANSTEFLSRWFTLMGHGTRSVALLDLLRSSGRIVGGNSLPHSLKGLLRTAVERGLLNGRSSVYRPRRDLTSEGDGVSSLSHNCVTHHAIEDSVTRSFSTLLDSGRRVPPSPLSFRKAKCNLPQRGGSRTAGSMLGVLRSRITS